MTVLVKNKLTYNGKTMGYTVCVDGIESKYSVHDAVKLVYTAKRRRDSVLGFAV